MSLLFAPNSDGSVTVSCENEFISLVIQDRKIVQQPQAIKPVNPANNEPNVAKPDDSIFDIIVKRIPPPANITPEAGEKKGKVINATSEDQFLLLLEEELNQHAKTQEPMDIQYHIEENQALNLTKARELIDRLGNPAELGTQIKFVGLP
jgi:hypothetical protein